jgi:hypothetical protein
MCRGRSLVCFERVCHCLLEGHRSSLGPRRLEGFLAQPGTRGRRYLIEWPEGPLRLVVFVEGPFD